MGDRETLRRVFLREKRKGELALRKGLFLRAAMHYRNAVEFSEHLMTT